MATVYLATQESVDREVALKVLLPGLMTDAAFADSFLREARIAAGLEHRHVVSIHDVGEAGGHYYIAMEYLSGGPLRAADGRPYPIAFSLRVIRQIAKALDYAHLQGVVHRDVTPDNILLRNDGAAVLTDFGIARSGAGGHIRGGGALIGSPHYMSPEWVRGEAIDGRADLYSLGTVLHELLTGRPPYVADDPFAVAQMHVDEPVPALPREMAALQGLLDRMMAKDRDARFQVGMDVAIAIKGIQQQLRSLNDELLDGARVMARAVDGTDEAVSNPPQADRHGRISPSMGALDEISIGLAESPDARRRRQSQHRPGRGWRLPVIGLAVAVLALTMWLGQDWLRAQWPRTEINQLVERGRDALAAGHLVGSDGDSARELFEAALAQDPDRVEIQDGLRTVGEQLLERAYRALGDDDIPAAREALEQAHHLLGGGVQVEAARHEVNRRQASESQLDTQLQYARERLSEGRLVGPDSAASVYQQIRAVDPDNAPARAGLERVAEQLARQARAALTAGDLETATDTIESMDAVLPGHSDIAGLRGELAQARAENGAQIAQWLADGEQALRAGRLGEGEGSAQEAFAAVLAREPDNGQARDGLRQVALGLILRARAALEDDGIAAAGEHLLHAARLAPELPELHAAREQLREASERMEIDAQRTPATAAQRERLHGHLAEAERAARAGNLIVPPGQSAYDQVRAALAIDGHDPDALAALQRLPEQARTLFDRSLVDRTPYRARIMYETAQQLSARDDDLARMRQQLTGAFLDEAQRHIGDGRRAEALRALDAAGELDPAHPRLPALRSRALGLSGN